MSKRNQYSAETKLAVVLEVLREEHTVNEIAAKFGVHPNMVSRWEQEFLEKAPEVFKRGKSGAEKGLEQERVRVAQLERKVGQLTCDVGFLEKNPGKCSDRDGNTHLINREGKKVSVSRQTELLGVNRSSVYRERREKQIQEEELALMELIDRIHTDNPTWGYRTITRLLRAEYGLLINRKRVRRIMRDMGIYAIYPKPNLSKRYHAAHIRPYLLRNLNITRPDQVWGIDITYIHMRKGRGGCSSSCWVEMLFAALYRLFNQSKKSVTTTIMSPTA